MILDVLFLQNSKDRNREVQTTFSVLFCKSNALMLQFFGMMREIKVVLWLQRTTTEVTMNEKQIKIMGKGSLAFL